MTDIGRFPTPVSRVSIDGTSLWVKHDDVSSPLYGGNKVRKLGRIFELARARQQSTLLTIGAAGSHHVLATTLHGRAAGFRVEAVLVPQPRTSHATRNLQAGVAGGLNVHSARNYVEAALQIAWERRRSDLFFIALGGSSALGSVGYVDAAHELAAQIASGAMPKPRAIVVALGSGGTAAGLAVGLAEAGLAIELHAVAIGTPMWALRFSLMQLMRQVGRVRGASGALMRQAHQSVHFVTSCVGQGYGFATAAGDYAQARAAEKGLMLEPTYTAKAFAYALQLAHDAAPVLYWHTLASEGGEGLQQPLRALSPTLDRLFI